MNTKTSLAVVMAAALLLVACGPSVNPYYHFNDIVFDPRLIGEWEAGPNIYRFDLEDDRYRLTIGDRLTLGESTAATGSPLDELFAEPIVFTATLFRLRDDLFLDLYATSGRMPAHLVAHVASVEPQLRVAVLDIEWLTEYLAENPQALSHDLIDGEVPFLTAETRELQRFLLQHFDDGQIFSEYGEFTKQAAAR